MQEGAESPLVGGRLANCEVHQSVGVERGDERQSVTEGLDAVLGGRAGDGPALSDEDALADRRLVDVDDCLLYTSPSPRDLSTSRMPSSA